MGYEQHIERVAARKAALKDKLASILGGRKRISFEIGSGHGHWLVEYAKLTTDKFCLGIDLLGVRIRKSNRKREIAELENIHFLQAEAIETLETMPEGIEIEEVFVLFPDPWPKKKHWKNRLINDRFLNDLAKYCNRGTRVHFRTDVEDYYNWSVEIIDASETWSIDPAAQWPFEKETVFQNRADTYYSLIFVKS